MTDASQRAAPKDYITLHQPNGFELFIRVSTISAIWTNKEEHAGIQTENFEWIVSEPIDVVLQKIADATGAPAPQRGKILPLPPDDMREGDLPKATSIDTYERDRSDADAAKSEN